MVGLNVALLGGFEVRLASGAAVALPMKKAQALLAHLALRPGQSHAREKLAALLWGEKTDEQARGSLRHALVALRKALAGATPPPLRVEGGALALDPAGVEVDVVAFERYVAEGTPHALEAAADLYRGDLLLGFAVSEPLFEEWLVAERERLREMALEALARLLGHQTGAADIERAIRTAVRLLALDPLQEAVHRTLMRLYARQGRRGAALKQYQLCVSVLRREIGTEPEAETRTLYQELLRRRTEATADADEDRDRRVRPGGRPPELPAPETALIGRRAELSRLRQLLEDAVTGRGSVATVVGEAGVGKTRLVNALAAEAMSRGCRVLLGRGHESDSILPFGPWVDACRGGELSSDAEVLAGLHPARRAELTRLFPEAGAAGLPAAGDSALPLFESVAALVEAAAARQPLLLLLEDLHWADEMTLRLLAFVGRRIAAWPVFLIVTAREEELIQSSVARRTLEDLSRDAGAVPIALAALSRAETDVLVQALGGLGTDATAIARIEEHIWAMSEGNPFVAVETTRAFDRVRADQPGALSLPASVRDLIARRLDRLGAPSQQLLAVAAVIGRRFDFTLLHAASGMDEQSAAEATEELVRHRVLQAVGNQLDFAHDRIRDVAYGRLLAPRRRLLHRRVADALESLGGGQVDQVEGRAGDRRAELAEQIAHHALCAESWDTAVQYLRQAGHKAASRSALQDARAWFEQALAALEPMPERPATLEQGFEIRLALRQVLSQMGEPRLMLERLREAEALAERLGDDRRRGQVSAFMTNVHSLLGELDEAAERGSRALAIAAGLGDVRLSVLTRTFLEQLEYYRGDYARVVELARDNLATVPVDRDSEYYVGVAVPASVFDRVWLIVALAQLGRFAEAAATETALLRDAEPTRHAFTVGAVHLAAATRALLQGDWGPAHAALERGLGTVRSANVVGVLPTMLASSAAVLAEWGDAGDAWSRVREAEDLLDRLARGGIVGLQSWNYQALGRACLRLGRLDEARRLAGRALGFASRHPGFMAYAHELLGDLEVGADRFEAERGEAAYRQALALAEPRGMRPLVAHCHRGLGTLAARADRGPEARSHLDRAITLYREMEMRSWLEQADALRTELGP